MLAELDQQLNAAGTSLVFAELKDPVRAKLERYELIGPLDPDHFFPTIDGAIEEFRRQSGAEWAPPAETVPSTFIIRTGDELPSATGETPAKWAAHSSSLSSPR